jgi:hypothetical protein
MHNCLLMLCLADHLSAVMARYICHAFFDVCANKIMFGPPVAIGDHSILEIREAAPGIFDVIIKSSGTAQDAFEALCTDHAHHSVHLLHFLFQCIWPIICDALQIACQDMYPYLLTNRTTAVYNAATLPTLCLLKSVATGTASASSVVGTAA